MLRKVLREECEDQLVADKPQSQSGLISWDGTVFSDLPLSLSARLALGRAKLGLLRRLQPGTIVNLDTQVGEPSRLVAEGAVVASGEIVEIQGHLALRLTKLGDEK